jgi:hypothetical protein
MKSITYTFGDWWVKIYAHGYVCIQQNALNKFRNYELEPDGNNWVDNVVTNGEYVYITMCGDDNYEVHLKFEGDNCIVLDKWSYQSAEYLDSIGAWDFINDEDEEDGE